MVSPAFTVSLARDLLNSLPVIEHGLPGVWVFMVVEDESGVAFSPGALPGLKGEWS